MKKKESRYESFNLLLHNQYESHLLCLCMCVRVHVIALNLYWEEKEREHAYESLSLRTSTWSVCDEMMQRNGKNDTLEADVKSSGVQRGQTRRLALRSVLN